jgi:hypothetical protein
MGLVTTRDVASITSEEAEDPCYNGVFEKWNTTTVWSLVLETLVTLAVETTGNGQVGQPILQAFHVRIETYRLTERSTYACNDVRWLQGRY